MFHNETAVGRHRLHGLRGGRATGAKGIVLTCLALGLWTVGRSLYELTA